MQRARPCCARDASARARRGRRADPGRAAPAGRRPSSATSPPRMYFTPDGLEQSTRLRVAEHRAARVAAAGTVLGARPRLRHRRRPRRLRARRAHRRRRRPGPAPGRGRAAPTSTPSGSAAPCRWPTPTEPRPVRLRRRVRRPRPPQRRRPGLRRRRLLPAVAVRASRLLDPAGVRQGRARASRTTWSPRGSRRSWSATSGDVKEAVLWSAHLATARRRATVIRPAGLATLTDEDDPGDRSVRPVGRYLYEPDGAVIRAGLVTAVAAGVERRAGRRAHRLRHRRPGVHARRSPAPSRCSRSCRSRRSRSRRRCASAASAG